LAEKVGSRRTRRWFDLGTAIVSSDDFEEADGDEVPKERGVSKNVERKNLAHVAKSRIARSLIVASSLGFSVFGFVACSGGTSTPQPIQSAPPSPLSAHLKQCYTAKLNGSARTVVREKIQVCRRDKTNQAIEHEITPRFQVGRTKGIKIGLRQVIAVKFSNPETASASGPDRLALEASALEFLTKGCAPTLNAIFQRSGFESSHRFQVYKPGDQVALSSEIGQNGKVTDAFEFGEPSPAKPTPGRLASAPSAPIEEDSAKRAYHLLLELKLSQASGLRLEDEVADVESGSLAGYMPHPPGKPIDAADAQETARLQFCGQLAMRVAENYGLSEGRDCKSISQAASEPAKASAPTEKSSAKSGKTAPIGLMKPGKEISDLGKLKLAKREIHEILSPVCGTLKDQKGLSN
jgi:hypothetical protein